MRVIISNILLTLTFLDLHLIELASGTGSKTYETNNGFPINFLNDIVNSAVVSKKLNSRWKWEVWDVVPGTHAYQIYVFNITNPDEVEKGGKPTLKQVGPYYYREYRYKFDVSMNLDMSVNFERNFTYTFDPTHSNGTEDDTVNTINLPFVIFSTLAAKYSKSPSDVNQAISALLATGENIIRKNVKIGDLLFKGLNVSNYHKYISLMGPSSPLTEEFTVGRHAILKLKSGAHEGQFTVDSGLKAEKKVGQIVTYNGRENLTYWSGEDCNKIRGSDGSVFPPSLKTTDKLYMLEVDFCRSVSFDYREEAQFNTVTGHIYSIGKDVLEEPGTNSENSCFCKLDSTSPAGGGVNSCLKKGVLDVSSCQFGAPYVMSYAHFWDASPEYQQGVAGLQPETKLHRTEVAVEPVTGAVITFHKRFQWNIWIKPIPGIDYFKKFHPVLVPVLWNDDVFTLDPDKEEILMEELASRGGGMGSGSYSTIQATTSYSRVSALAILIIFAVLILGQ